VSTSYLARLLVVVGLPLIVVFLLPLAFGDEEKDGEKCFKVCVDDATVAEFVDRRDAYRKAMELSRERKELVRVKRDWLTVATFRGGIGR